MQFQSFQIVPCGKKSFPTSLLEKGGKVRKEFKEGGGEKGESHFVTLFWRGDWDLYDPKIDICKINYYENRVKHIVKKQ